MEILKKEELDNYYRNDLINFLNNKVIDNDHYKTFITSYNGKDSKKIKENIDRNLLFLSNICKIINGVNVDYRDQKDDFFLI